LVDVLEQTGFKALFGLQGGHIDPIIHAARDAGLRMVDVRHEAVAGYAADGFVRTTGEPAACVVTAGPGFTNVLTAMTSSYLDRIPVLYLAGAVPLREAETNALQGNFDQVAMARPVTKWAERATSAETVVPLAEAAIRAMYDGAPGPAFLEIPIDVVFEEIEHAPALTGLVAQAPRPAPAPSVIADALALLESAERPVILAGTGALLSGCASVLREFAERARIPVYTNTKALGILPGSHPLACGSFVNLARASITPDVVLILGARNGLFMGGSGHDVIPADAVVIHVDVDSREIGRLHRAAVPIVADCRETLRALLVATEAHPERSKWAAAAGEAARWHEAVYADALDDDRPDMHPYRLATAVAARVDARTIIVQDGGDTGSWTEVGVGPKAAGPGKYLSTGYLGNLGMTQGLGIAAQLAHPDHRVVCMTGDGAVGLQLQEFDTMVRHQLPIVTVVFNNRLWGMSYEFQVRQPDGLTWVELGENIRYDLVCEACGGHGELVTRPDELEGALSRAFDSRKPACVNVYTRSAASPKTEAFMRAEGIDDIVLPYYENLVR
jgi:acetolactate synthase-1/2/3 large subunit